MSIAKQLLALILPQPGEFYRPKGGLRNSMEGYYHDKLEFIAQVDSRHIRVRLFKLNGATLEHTIENESLGDLIGE